MNLREPKTQQAIVFIVLMIVVLVLFFKFPYSGNQKKIKTLEDTVQVLRARVQEAEAAKARLPELQARIARLEAEWDVAKEMLPQEKEIPKLIQQISYSGTKAGVSFILFKPSGPNPKENYQEIPVQIKVACGYHQLGRFLSNVGNLSRIVNVPAIKIIHGKDRSTEAELRTITYTVAKPKEVPSVAPARKPK